MLVIAAAAALAAAVSPAANPAVGCGVISSHGARYLVRVEQGRMACTTARAGMLRFIATAAAPKRWICFRGHSTQRWAAVCTRSGTIVRAYLR